jgi:PPK2 family polyphosphate:nucleotide phosphotransferase
MGSSTDHRFDPAPFRVPSGRRVRLKDYPTAPTHDLLRTQGLEGKKEAKTRLEHDVSVLAEAQRLLWADGRRAVLMILQGLDAAGKDGTIRHVMSGVNPQGCEVHSFKAPSAEELDHPFLWRPTRFLPAKGRIGIFNRSYYEEVLVVRVHPDFLTAQRLPHDLHGKALWRTRYEDINAFERFLVRGGTSVLKFYLHLSREEQKERFMERLTRPDKNWKFSASDLRERRFWPAYTQAYQDMLSATSTEWAPWYVIPADKKWFSRALVADVLTRHIEGLDLHYPEVSDEDRRELEEARRELEAED